VDTPIDVIAAAVRANHGLGPMPGLPLSEMGRDVATALGVLTDDLVIDHAVAAVQAHPWTSEAADELSERELRAVLRVAFGSIVKEA
jgi:hypothetical protein